MPQNRTFFQRVFGIYPKLPELTTESGRVTVGPLPDMPSTVKVKNPANVRRLGRALGGRQVKTKVSQARRKQGGKHTEDLISGYWSTPTLLPPRTNNHAWSLQELDIYLLEQKGPEDVLTDLVDISPEVGRGLWDFLRMANAGWEYKVLKVNSEQEDAKAKKRVDEFLDMLKLRHGSIDVLVNRMFFAAWLRGAFFGEIVLDKRGRKPVDLVFPDPVNVQFEAREDSELGLVWELHQVNAAGELVSIDYPTVRYIPIDPLPSSPYGRPMCSPAVFTSLFLLGLLYDLRRVIAQQGYPRIDIVVKIKEIFESLPADVAEEIETDFDTYSSWVESIIEQVETAYASLEPDDTYVHSDSVDINRPIGIDSSSLSAVGGLIGSLERMCVRALKTMPILMGIDGGGSEGAANRQWEIHVAGIKSLQHLGESLLESLLEQGLRAQGIQATIQWRFAELRVAELLRDEQVMELRLTNAAKAYELGYYTQEQAAMHAVKHAPASEKPLAQIQAEQEQAMLLEAAKAMQTSNIGGTGGAVEAPDDKQEPPSLEMGIE